MTFGDFNLKQGLPEALAAMHISVPTEVQEMTIPRALANESIAVESETGTGKTLAFLLPIFTRLVPGSGKPRAVIVCPTHELAAQTHRVSDKLAKASGIGLKGAVILGGVSLNRQYDMLRDKPDIVVGTSGRLAELIRLGKLETRTVDTLVLDEADRLFSKELTESSSYVIDAMPRDCALQLFSATVTRHAMARAMTFGRDIKVLVSKRASVLREDIEHVCMFSERRDKIDAIRRFEHAVHPERVLVFARTSGDVLNALLKLRHSGIPCEAIHGDFDSDTRRDSLDMFRTGKVRYLVTSDVAARGLDIENVSHVIMLDPPDSRESFVHRAGRTGRAGKKGVSIVLADTYELKKLSAIAVSFGFNFKVKKLHSGALEEITVDEFFEEANYSFNRRKTKALAKQPLPGGIRNRPPRRENHDGTGY